MKKRVLIYVATIIATLSMQSCVTNYVVAEPSIYTKQYKSDAKSEENKSNELKKELISSFVASSKSKINSIDHSLKSAEAAVAARKNKLINTILTEAETYLGTPYRFGGMSRSGIDCSAFVLSVFGAAAGMNLPRNAASQSGEGDSVQKEELQKGDLVFFSHGRGRISHVGIVYDVTAEGDVKFIHSATSKGVMISSLTDSYWGPKYRFAKRVLNDNFLTNNEQNIASLN